MGIGNTTAAAALAAALFSGGGVRWAGRGTGLDDQGVARKRAVFFTHDPDANLGWLDDYFPGLAGMRYPRLAEFDELGGVTVEPVPIPADCTDGFTAAYWRRPEAYLDEAVRANMSTFALLDERAVADGAVRLAHDLADRTWHRRYARLVAFDELDVGYRLVVAALT